MTAQANAPTRLYTADEFEALVETPEYHDRRLELIDGELVEKVTTEEHGLCASAIHIAIGIYLKSNPIGRVTQGVHYRAADQVTDVRIPDVAVTVDARLVSRKGSVPRLPDLAVEMKSRANTLADLQDKARYYIANGTRMVWIIVPSKQFVIVVTPTSEDILDATDTLTGGDVLPGFTLPVAEIFKDTQAGVSAETTGLNEGT